jgi:hypothetical protein
MRELQHDLRLMEKFLTSAGDLEGKGFETRAQPERNQGMQGDGALQTPLSCQHTSLSSAEAAPRSSLTARGMGRIP